MRHVLFFSALALYMVVISQNWSVYTAVILAVLWLRNDGQLNSVPFTIGGPREPNAVEDSAPPVTNGT